MFRRPDRIVLGSDSLFQARAGGNVSTFVEPKIRVAGRWHFLAVGYRQHPGAETDIHTLITRAIRSTPTLPAALDGLLTLKTDIAQGLYSTDRAGGSPVFSVFVAGLEHDVLTVLYFTARVLDDRSRGFRVEFGHAYSPGKLGDSHALSIIGGPALALMGATPRPAWLEAGTADAAYRLIELQAEATPDMVGGLIDVVTITRHGAEWFAPNFDEERTVAS